MKKNSREMYLLIKELLGSNAEVVTFCDEKLAAIDKKNKNASESRSKKTKEQNEGLIAAAIDLITKNGVISHQELIKELNVSSSKVTYLMTVICDRGVAEKFEEKHKVKYRLAKAEVDSEVEGE